MNAHKWTDKDTKEVLEILETRERKKQFEEIAERYPENLESCF
jgi:hypothetical protein